MNFPQHYYLQDNPACKRTKIQIGVQGKNLDPSKVTEILEISPTISYAKGDLFQTRNGTRERKVGLWLFRTEACLNSTSPERHAEYLLEKVEPKLDNFKAFLSKNGYACIGSLWWEGIDYHGGFTLTAKTLKRLSQIVQEMHFYFISSEFEEESDLQTPDT